MFEAVIFDWDGTLADTRAVILKSFHQALREIDADVTDQQIARLIGVGSAETFRQLLRSQNRPFTEAQISNLIARKVDAELALDGEVKLFPGAFVLLQSLRGKVRLALASMNNRVVIDDLLQTTRTAVFFEATVTADEVTKSKPDPEIFLAAAQKLHTRPERCVVVEDSIFGVKAAKAAGTACVAVAQGSYSKEELAKAGADLVVSALAEHAAILSFILRK